MSTGEHKADVSQDTELASQPTHTGGTAKITSQNIPKTQSQKG